MRASQNDSICSWPLSCQRPMGSGTQDQGRQILGKAKDRRRILWSRQENPGSLSSRVRDRICNCLFHEKGTPGKPTAQRQCILVNWKEQRKIMGGG